MADEAAPTNDGSLEAAAAALGEARKEAAAETRQPEPADTAPAATDSASEEMPDAPTEEHDAKPEDNPDTVQTTVEYPPGWNAEDQAWFDTLEPARQEAILRREKGTQAAESRRQNEHQAAVRQAQEAAQQAAHERQYLQSQLQHYKHPIVAAYQAEFPDVVSGQIDHFRLAQNPERWGRYQAFQSEFQRIGQAEMQLAQRAEQDEQSRLSQYIEDRNTKLLEAKPELKDSNKFQAFDNEVTGYLRGLEISDDRIARISFGELQIVEKAMLWDKAQKAKASAPRQPAPLQAKHGQTVVQSHVRTVLKPGVPRGAGGNDEKIAAIDQRARQSGSLEDAAERLRLRRENLQRRA